jgi:hypothetical protein
MKLDPIIYPRWSSGMPTQCKAHAQVARPVRVNSCRFPNVEATLMIRIWCEAGWDEKLGRHTESIGADHNMINLKQ